MFKLWSETSADAKAFLKPDFGLRNWDELNLKEKRTIWLYLRPCFFNEQIKEYYDWRGDVTERYHEFYGNDKEKEVKRLAVFASIGRLNERNKAKSFGKNFLENGDLNAACADFYSIFTNESENVVIELLSIYSSFLVETRIELFNDFAEKINDVFLQFGVKYYLAKECFILRQDEKIIEEIYKPVLSYLSDKRWGKVSENFSDALLEYRKNTPQGYSTCVTKSITSAEAFLQILVDGKTGGRKLSILLQEAQKTNLIPNDNFSITIFKNIDSILALERKQKGDAHPKDDYATEKNARIMLNLVMIFIQHCIQN